VPEHDKNREHDENRKAETTMQTPPIVTAQEWESARQQLLVKEKEVTRARDALAALARDWDGSLGALKDHLDRSAGGPATTPLHETPSTP